MIESEVLVLSVSVEEEDDTYCFFTNPPLEAASELVLASVFAEEALNALRNVLLDMLEIPLLLRLSEAFLSKAILLVEEEESFLPSKEDLVDAVPFWMLVLRCPKGALELRVAMVGR
jgi:hypothetical protein